MLLQTKSGAKIRIPLKKTAVEFKCLVLKHKKSRTRRLPLYLDNK